MGSSFKRFESITRQAFKFTTPLLEESVGIHPFDERNMHPSIVDLVQQLFDDAHYAQAAFEAYKFVDRKVAELANLSKSETDLMMQAFSEKLPHIKLAMLENENESESEADEQKGYKFLFAGSMLAIRNPRGHEFNVRDSPTECLDHLSLASMLLRRLDKYIKESRSLYL